MFSDNEAAYLKSQTLGRIATANVDSQPDVAPVGFDFDGTYFYVGGHNLERTLKYRNVLANRNVAFVIDDLVSMDPWTVRGIKVHGVAEIVTRDGYVGPGTYIRIIRDGSGAGASMASSRTETAEGAPEPVR